MQHELITAPSFTQLEEAFWQEVSRQQSQCPLNPVVVMTGSRPQGEQLGWQGAVRQGKIFNVRFLTMHQLASELLRVAELCGEDVPLILPDFAPLYVIHQLVREDVVDNDYFNELSSSTGFRRALKGTLTDLHEGNLNPDLLRIDELQEPGIREQRLRCLLSYYIRYMTSIQTCGCTFNMLPSVAAHFTHHFVKCFGTDSLIVYGMYDFNQIQFQFLHDIPMPQA